MPEKIKIAVITEGHPIDVIRFYDFFNSFDEFDVYIQALETIASDDENMDRYDSLVFYNLSLEKPDEGTRIRQFSEKHLGSTKQGVFLLHHGMLSYADWPLWNAITGLQSRQFKYTWNQTMAYDIVDPNHPITKGMRPWSMMDEAYLMDEPDRSCQVLLATEHPLSLKSIAWVHQYGKSRVFCYASGHDDSAYRNGSFKEIVRRGVLWTACKL